MTDTVLARRYAEALFALGQQNDKAQLKTYGEQLETLLSIITKAPKLMQLFRNPLFSIAEKQKVLKAITENFVTGKTVQNFCYLLAEKERLPLLPSIQEYYSAMLDEEEKIVRGDFITAITLSVKKQQEILTELEKKAGKRLILTFSTDTSILGGLVLKIGDKVLDASLRAQLEMLKENIKRGE